MANHSKSYIYYAYFGLFMMGLIDNTRGPLYPDILRYFQISNAKGSLIFSLASLAGLVATLTSKYWLEKLGAVRASKLMGTFNFLALILFVLGAWIFNSFALFLLGSIFFGISIGSSSISLNLIVANNAPVLEQRKHYSGLHSMYGISSLLAPLLISQYLKLDWPWYWYFLILAIIPAIYMMVGVNFSSQNIREQSATDNSYDRKEASLLGLVFSFYVAAEILISTRLVLFVEDFWHFPKAQGLNYLSVFFIGILLVRVSMGLRQSSFDSKKILIFCLGLSLFFCTLGLYYHPLFLAISGASMAPIFPTAMGWVSERNPGHADGMLPIIMSFVGVIVVIMHFGFGLVTNYLGINASMHLVLIFLAISLIVLMTFFKTKTVLA